ncbi:MAG TPA: thioredoxin family protein [Vicinamibacteria bacterium]|jgi:peroxiredoxin
MNRSLTLPAAALGSAVLLGIPAAARAQAAVGRPAPAFSAPDQTGATRTLDSYKGQWVVLEWVNHECPFVQKHYGSGNMQKTQKAAEAKGAVWLSVSSSAPGKQGAMDAAQATALTRAKQAAPSAVLLDPQGTIGRAYGAKTTPHMYVIDPKGTLVYAGAIDDKPSTDPADVAGAKNYVLAALDEAMAGRPVTVASTQPYGCSVKY